MKVMGVMEAGVKNAARPLTPPLSRREREIGVLTSSLH